MKNNKPKSFLVNTLECDKCGICIDICWNGCLVTGEEGFPEMPERKIFDEWNMCWECHRCLAYCPNGAISICGKNPKDSIPYSDIPSGQQMDAMIVNRRSCRSYIKKTVDPKLLKHIFKIAATLPTGSCNQLVEFTVIDNIDEMNRFKEIFYKELFQQIERGHFPDRFTKEDMDMIRNLYDNGNDIVFRGAPHLVVPHAPINKGEWVVDTAIGLTYLELLMISHGLGAIILSFIRAALDITPETRSILKIPEDHYMQVVLAFGYPRLVPSRGVQRFDYLKVHRVKINNTQH